MNTYYPEALTVTRYLYAALLLLFVAALLLASGALTVHDNSFILQLGSLHLAGSFN